ncbi:ABC transporter substrate-binding protein [Motilimonas pumila]|uniref:Probable sugar-binding periplasmic protein n=1 Tax=Motilimonas pumila TaxID=2303987 RepID=A0A418YE85_9GAMM|nr:ABC transporter substrate-binding protein [Motilimonas pumila]RJG47465.1 carbohydrate ABC transporter substrate-binding protein [Motilimonas pumila]
MKKILALAFSCCSLLPVLSHSAEVEVLHWWTSDSEKQALQLVQEQVNSQHQWRDFAVTGGGGNSAMTVLKTRVISGNPPAGAQIKGPDINDWARLDLLQPLDSLAIKQKWQQVFPQEVLQFSQLQGHYYAVPINIHRVNWLWINQSVFNQLALTAPTTWEQFIEVAQQLQQAGIEPLAHGIQPWQNTILFESIAIAKLGPINYRRAFVKHDPEVLASQAIVETFNTLRQVQKIVSPQAADRNWDKNAQVFIEGKAGMMIMGDWVKGELTNGQLVAGEDYLCLPTPGSQRAFIYNIDTFVFFKTGQSQLRAQLDLAQIIADPQLQTDFSLQKGSIPARLDADISALDTCSRQAHDDFSTQQLVPSMAQDMANTGHVQNAIANVVNYYFKNPNVSAEKASQQLKVAILASQG